MEQNGCIDCCACGLCELVCPKDAIIRKEGKRKSELFLKGSNCIGCGICDSYCPLKKDMFHKKQNRFYKALSNDEKTLTQSASGGIAQELSKFVISQHGVVYGAAWNPLSQSVEHLRADSETALKGFRGSKYVHSIITPGTYREVNNSLAKSKVLFIGTPCQVAAIRSYTHDSPNLYTIDLICHGVPSPEMLGEHLRYITNSPVRAISFRNRATFRLRVDDGEAVYKSPWEEDSYYALYMLFASLREYCYKCKFARNERVGDITVGDYIEDGKGYSCIVVNTDRGYKLFNQITPFIESDELDIQLLNNNHAFNRPTAKHPNTERFTKLYEQFDLETAYKKAFRSFIIKRKIRTILGDRIYDFVKGFISQKG